MVGQAGTFVGFDEHVVGTVDGRYQEVETGHRQIEHVAGPHRRLSQNRVELGGHVMDGPSGVEVGGSLDGQGLAVFELSLIHI